MPVPVQKKFFFYNCKSMRKIFIAKGRVTPKWMVQSGTKSNSSEILWMFSLPASMRKIRSKMKSLSIAHFPHYKSMGAFGCRGNQSFIWSAPKPYAAFPQPKWCYIKNSNKIGQKDVQRTMLKACIFPKSLTTWGEIFKTINCDFFFMHMIK